MNLIAGINGFGRFGLHLLKYWLDRNNDANFTISYINDDVFSLEDIYHQIMHDKSVLFNKYKVKIVDQNLVILEPNGVMHKIEYTNLNKDEISLVGKPTFVFECSWEIYNKR